MNDPDARHTRKSQQARRDGYRAHVAADPDTGIITDEKLTRAAGQDNSDPAVAEEFAAAEASGDGGAGDAGSQDDGGDDTLAWYGDTAYGTGDLRNATGKAGQRAVIKPKPVQPAVEGGFTRDGFAVDEQAGTVTCPAGITRTIPPSRHVVFGAACRTCPLRYVQVRAGAQPAPPRPAAAPPAPRGRLMPGCARTTPGTGPTWNGSSPRSPPSAAAG